MTTEPQADIVERLVQKWPAGGLRNPDGREAAAEITRLRARLEVEPGWSESADGIACRDETIRLQDAQIASLRAELAEARLQGRREGLEAGARVADRRAEDRFAEYGVTEPDTNASYYDGRRAEALDELDEEDWAIRDAIRSLDPTTLPKDAPK